MSSVFSIRNFDGFCVLWGADSVQWNLRLREIGHRYQYWVRTTRFRANVARINQQSYFPSTVYIFVLIQLHSKDFSCDNHWLVASRGDLQTVHMHIQHVSYKTAYCLIAMVSHTMSYCGLLPQTAPIPFKFRQYLQLYIFKSFSHPLHASRGFLALLANHYFPVSTIFHTRMLHHCISCPQGPISTGFCTWLSTVTIYLSSPTTTRTLRETTVQFFFTHKNPGGSRDTSDRGL